MSRLLSFVSGLFAAVSLIFLALSAVLVGPFAYAGPILSSNGPRCVSYLNCMGGNTNACHGKTAVCETWIVPLPPDGWSTVECFCDGKYGDQNGRRVFACTGCYLPPDSQ